MPRREWRSNSLKLPFSKAGDDVRVLGVGQDDVAALLELLGLLQALDLDLAADVLGPLAPLELDDLDAELFDGVFLDAQPRVLDVGLDDDRAVAVVPSPWKSLTRISMSGQRTTRPFLISDSSSMPQTFSPMVRMVPGDGRPDGQPFPVLLGHVGRAHAGHDEGDLELDRLVLADPRSRS